MSWKLGKKLKESHISALSPFTHFTKGKPLVQTASDDSSSTSLDSIRKSLDSSTGDGRLLNSTIKPGLLILTVYEAVDLEIFECKSATESKNQDVISSCSKYTKKLLPYMVIEIDKNEIVVDSIPHLSSKNHPVWNFNGKFDVSRRAVLSCQIYLPQSADHSKSEADIFIGRATITPFFIEDKVYDDWVDLQGKNGSLHIKIVYQGMQLTPLTIEAFDLLKVVGKGSFGKVMQVRKKDTLQIYALKTIRKAHIVSRSEVDHTLAERTVLAQVNNPFIVPLKFSFQSPEKLYIVLAFVNGGELFHHLQRAGRFDVWRSKFYAAELLCALEHLHDFNVIYRDLKPENILLDYTGHIALCDFGLCKLNMAAKDKTNTFCGTPEYLAPELLIGKGYTKAVDWWTLGVLLYEMLTGLPPFYDENVNEMYKKILNNQLRFPNDIDKHAKNLLIGLLTRDPKKRLGSQGAAEIREHHFFAKEIDWKKLIQKKIQPPFKPSVESAIDTSNFDSEFTSELPVDSLVADSHLSATVQQRFVNWSYQPPSAIDEANNSNHS